MKRAILWVLALIALGAVAGGGYWFLQTRTGSTTGTSSEAGTYTQVVTVERGDLTATLSVVGQLEAVQSATLNFEEMSAMAPLLSLEVQAGNQVKAGQVLATIDPAPYQQALDQAQSDLQAAEEALADLQTPPSALEIAQADLAVAQAEFQVEKARASLDDLLHPDFAQLQAAVASAETALAEAQAKVAQLEQGADSDQMARLREADAKAWTLYSEWAAKEHAEDDEAYHDRLTLLYNRMKDAQDALVSAEVQAEVNKLQARMDLRRQQQALAQAQEALAEARAGGDPLALAQARLAVQEAQVSLEAARQKRAELDQGPDATSLAAAQANLDKKRLALAQAQEALQGTSLLAPFDATILETYVAQGDTIAANTPILSLANLNSLQVVASVDETTIRQVSQGQKATVTFDAFPGQTFRAQVLSVPLQGSLQGGVTVYEVPLSLSGAEALNLLIGMTANVEIQVGQATNALLVPTMALQKVSGAYQVLVPNTMDPNGEPESVPVEVGLSNGTYTQVLRGLNDGDQVIVQIESTESNLPFPGMGGPGGGVMIIEGQGGEGPRRIETITRP